MPENCYREAQKRGQKEFRTCLTRGEHPYLARLDDVIPGERIAQGVDVGVLQVPAEFIVGTRTSGRTNAFARNFMPLLGEDTEFARKWADLCRAHLAEGIRDPITAYEYMGRFYVQEGNKRVSVLKFFDTPIIAARVIRILPERSGSKEVELYYEFLEFCRCTGVNFLELSKPGSYDQLQRLMGKEPGQSWTDEERRMFASAYYCFRQAFESSSRARSYRVGDAMLIYIRIYGFQDLVSKTTAQLKKMLRRMWEEIALYEEDDPIDLKLDPEDAAARRESWLLGKLLPKGENRVLKAAFIHDKDPGSSVWTYGHDVGREQVQRVFQGELETCAFYHAMDDDPLAVIEQAIGQGSTVIFTTSPRLLPASLRAAVDHPEVTILNCSLNTSQRHVRTYYARMYEVKFIAGAIAGSLAGNNPVGYVCDYPIFGQVAGINAFALGVQMTNPRARVLLEWSSVGCVSAAVKRLMEQGVSLICAQDLPWPTEQRPSGFGLSLFNQEGQVALAMPVWQWGVYYEELIRQLRSKSLQEEYAESAKAFNYYWGMSAGVVELECTDTVPDSTRKLAAMLKDSICAGIVSPFSGPIYDQQGRLVVGEGQKMDPSQIMDMDFLVEQITGEIPKYDQLSEIGKATVGIVGVEPTKEK